MKKVLLIALISSGVSLINAQTQIGNSDFEQWEAVSGGDEPVNWNSFLTAQGNFSGLGAEQAEPSTDVRPGSSGTKSCRIWTRDLIIAKANGNITVGIVNMGSSTPSSSSNYNISLTADPNFSEAFTGSPDSLVFWAKFTPNSASSEARVKATIHDNYDYRDPEDSPAAAHVFATAVLNYTKTDGAWKRFSVPFVYSGPASSANYILITFTTNKTPGGGDGDDEVLIDDVEMIYNPATSGVSELDKNDGIVVSMNNSKGFISIDSKNELKGDYTVFNALGQEVKMGNISSKIDFNAEPGVYFIHLNANGKSYSFEFLKN